MKKSNGSLPHAITNVGSASKVSEEVPIIAQVLPDVLVSGNLFMMEKYIDTLYQLLKCILYGFLCYLFYNFVLNSFFIFYFVLIVGFL